MDFFKYVSFFSWVSNHEYLLIWTLITVTKTNIYLILFFRKEIAKVMQSSYLRALNMASFFIASKIILFFTFVVYVLLGNTITASRVFVTVSLYSAVRLTVTLFFPAAIQTASEGLISIRRIKVSLSIENHISCNFSLHGNIYCFEFTSTRWLILLQRNWTFYRL